MTKYSMYLVCPGRGFEYIWNIAGILTLLVEQKEGKASLQRWGLI